MILYPAVSAFLSAWDKSREPSVVAFRIVGAPHSPEAHRLRDDLSRIGIPYRFLDGTSDEGRRLRLLLETGMPGVFAAGDVRHRSIKRVASAVGEGATAIRFVHDYLQAEHRGWTQEDRPDQRPATRSPTR